MANRASNYWKVIGVAGALAGLVAWPGTGRAQSRTLAVSGAVPSGLTSIEGLTIGGVPVSATGAPNQAISLAGLSVILNEQIQSASGIVVNALHVTTPDGLINVVVGSAKAGI